MYFATQFTVIILAITAVILATIICCQYIDLAEAKGEAPVNEKTLQ